MPLPRKWQPLALSAALALTAGSAIAGPQITVGDRNQSLEDDGKYTLTCWQNGNKVFEETDIHDLAGLELRDAAGLNIGHRDGTRRIVYTEGENLCIVELGKD